MKKEGCKRKITFEKKKHRVSPGSWVDWVWPNYYTGRSFDKLGLVQPSSPGSTYQAGPSLITMLLNKRSCPWSHWPWTFPPKRTKSSPNHNHSPYYLLQIPPVCSVFFAPAMLSWHEKNLSSIVQKSQDSGFFLFTKYGAFFSGWDLRQQGLIPS